MTPAARTFKGSILLCPRGSNPPCPKGSNTRAFSNTHGKKGYRVLTDVDEFAIVDVLQISPEGKQQHIELKERNIDINQYPDCLVDEAKIRKLQQLHGQTNEKVMVVALYPKSSKIAIWVVREDDEYEVRTVNANATSVQMGQSVKKPKQMIPLLLKDALIYNHQFEQ